jgi:cysteinyl-tRNA synthetase
MPIKLFDSLTREIRELRRPDPNNPKDVFSFYNCGPTVYAPAHIGNFRTFIVNDVLRRLLELEYGPDKVRYVRNLTDVDDKTIKRSRDEGRPLADVTKQWTQKFHDDCARLNCLPVSEKFEPTATGYIREQVDMIDVLMKKGNAYRAPDGSVYFKVSSFPNYGTLSRVKERELKSGSAFAADADEKEDLSDFALWKAHKADDGDNAWDSPWGRGRPGWHIECSAMSKALLGDTIDLHTGGVDLLFPHHENEIAQSECCNGTKFSRHWYHSEHLLVDGKKMSKSLGNLYTLDDLTAKGFSPMALRYALLAGHPRKQLNFSLDSLHAAEKAFSSLEYQVERMLDHAKLTKDDWPQFVSATPVSKWAGTDLSDALDALKADLNTPSAYGVFFSYINQLAIPTNEPMEARKQRLFQVGNLVFALGLNLFPTKKVDKAPSGIEALAEKRWAAKQAKDFAGADALRKELTTAGWSMLDGKNGYKLEPIKK